MARKSQSKKLPVITMRQWLGSAVELLRNLSIVEYNDEAPELRELCVVASDLLQDYRFSHQGEDLDWSMEGPLLDTSDPAGLQVLWITMSDLPKETIQDLQCVAIVRSLARLWKRLTGQPTTKKKAA